MLPNDQEYQNKVGFFLMEGGEVIEHSSSYPKLVEKVLKSEVLSDSLARGVAISMLREQDYILTRAGEGHGGKRILGTFHGLDYLLVVIQPD